MNRIYGPVALSLFTLVLCGCGTSKPIHYYALQHPTAPALTAGSQSISLVVADINGPEIFKASPIAYRTGTNEVGTYQFSRWVEPPTEMVQSSLISALKSSGNYSSVGRLGSTSVGQYVVRGHIYAFEEVDGATISGLVSMEFELYDRKYGKVVWSHYYSQSEPVQSKEISAIVTALDANLDRCLKETAAGLNAYFASNASGKS
jgi:ABC-type uncharacterized transport system auxiliary subunit